MNRYWDMTKRERAELTHEQIEALLTVELMEKGVVKIDPPNLIPVIPIPEPDMVLYAPKAGYGTPDYGYRTADEAARMLNGAVTISSDYIGGKSIKTAKTEDLEIAEVKVYSKELLTTHRVAIEKNNAAELENSKAKKLWEEADKKVSDATKSLWSDYYECQSLATRMCKVRDTYKEYVATCAGDEVLAFTFLKKAFLPDDITGAFEWFGIDVPELAPCEAVAVGSAEEF